VSDQPHFRFYPNAYAEGGPFKRSLERCEICDRPAVWLYSGEIYAEDDAPPVCARCIASGALRTHMPKDGFVMQDIVIEDVEAELAAEILYRTPGVASINCFGWPVRDGQPLAYLGVGDEAGLRADASVRAAILEASGGEETHGSHALMFRSLDGATTVAVFDFD
jgi:uncharacterized protein CbrC (UPF0167 family)